MAEYAKLETYNDPFTLEDAGTGELFNVQWDRGGWHGRPTKTKYGITGWAWINGKLTRAHVCAHKPCQACWSPAAYGDFPAPRHGRLVVPVVTGVAESAWGAASTEAAAAPAAMSSESMPPAIEALVGGRTGASMSVGVAASCAKLREGISSVLKFSSRGKFRTF